MNDHELGARLRQQVLADLQRGIPSDGRRLQALVGDLCGDRQLPLLPALKYLVMSAAFSSAVGQDPPLAPDGRLQLRLQQELDQVFTAAICQRMAAVLRGLLGFSEAEAAPLPPPPVARPAAPAPANPAEDEAGALPAAALEELMRESMLYGQAQGGGNRGVVAVLSFMAGVLVVGVFGAMAWMLSLSRQPLAPLNPPAAEQTTPAPTTPPEPAATTEPPPAPDLSQPQADPQAAIATVQQLYTDISSRNTDAARQLFSPAAADQFDPTFFSQFQQVSVSELSETGRSGTTVTLSGVVTFLYPDGTSQSESRSFTVDTATQPALITGSSFGAVLKPRG
ncbi:MAG: hypothetical protein ACKO0M_00710 [Cyanobium sp.]